MKIMVQTRGVIAHHGNPSIMKIMVQTRGNRYPIMAIL